MIDLRDYQQNAIDMLRQAIKEGARAPILVLPTGAGKSRTAAAIAEMGISKGQRTHFTAPRRNIVAQTASGFSDLGLDTGIIMSGEEFDPRHMVDISSIDTLMARINLPHSVGAESLRLSKIFIYDEAHCYSSPARASLINDLRKGAYGPGKIVIGLTATPAVSGGGGLANICDRLIQPVTMKDLISAGHLLQPEYYAAPSPDLAGVKIINGDYNARQLGEVYDDGIMGCVIDNWMALAHGTSTVVFTATRANAASVIEKFGAHGIPAAYLDCKTPDDERQRIFDAVRAGDILVIANVGIVGMGTDIPILQTACLAVATKSISRWMQWVGRVLRPYGDQQYANIIDHGNNVRRLGRCEDIDGWSLDERLDINERAESAVKKPDKKEVKCNECSHLFRGTSVCPKCGHKIPAQKVAREEIEFTPAKLQRIDGKSSMTAAEKRNKTMDISKKSNIYGQFASYVASKGKDPNYAKHLYREYMGVWPNAVGQAEPTPPGAEVLGFIQHRARKQSYAKKNGR